MRNWYVITGGPSAGKTTLLEALENAGCHVEHESARIVIDEGIAAGKSITEIRADEQAFQKEVYEHKLAREQRLDPRELIFFDRGMQDTTAYLQLHGYVISEHMRHEISFADYRKIYLLQPYSYEKDYARTESEPEQERLFTLLKEAYTDSHNHIEVIPPFPTKEERIEYFLNLVKNDVTKSTLERS